MQMLTPDDIMEDGLVAVSELSANCHYLHDRSLIELLVGYNPPMFAAARIAPKGIDLYEDPLKFDKLFPENPAERRLRAPNVIPVMMRLAQESERSPMEGLRREWLLRDLGQLREKLRQVPEDWEADAILNDLEWLEGILQEEGLELEAFSELQSMLKAWLT